MRDVTNILRDLIAICRDSEAGFREAAKEARDDGLRHRFLGIAAQRADFAAELGGYLKKLGVEPPPDGHASASLHSGWRELGSGPRPKDDSVLITECETGEENTLHHYEHALTQDLPTTTRPVVDRQRLGVQEALLELRNLEALPRMGR